MASIQYFTFPESTHFTVFPRTYLSFINVTMILYLSFLLKLVYEIVVTILYFRINSNQALFEGSDSPKQLICLHGICRLKAEMIAYGIDGMYISFLGYMLPPLNYFT